MAHGGGGPLGSVVVGLVLVFLDLRFDGIDMLPDLVGWTIALVGLVPLARHHAWFAAAAVAAGVGALVGVPQLVAEPGPVLATLQAVVETVVVFGVCSGIRAVSSHTGVRRTADRLRWVDLGLALLLLCFGLAFGEWGRTVALDGGGVALVLLLGLASLVVMVWFLVFCWSHRGDPELQAAAASPA